MGGERAAYKRYATIDVAVKKEIFCQSAQAGVFHHGDSYSRLFTVLYKHAQKIRRY